MWHRDTRRGLRSAPPARRVALTLRAHVSAHYQSPSLGHTISEAGLGPLSSLSWARRRESRAGMGIFQAQHNSSLAAFVVKFMMKI